MIDTNLLSSGSIFRQNEGRRPPAYWGRDCFLFGNQPGRFNTAREKSTNSECFRLKKGGVTEYELSRPICRSKNKAVSLHLQHIPRSGKVTLGPLFPAMCWRSGSENLTHRLRGKQVLPPPLLPHPALSPLRSNFFLTFQKKIRPQRSECTAGERGGSAAR